jgi:hypothetical protein
MNSLTMPLWQQLLLLFCIPLVIGMTVVWWKVNTMSKQGSSKPLRKRKRRRH